MVSIELMIIKKLKRVQVFLEDLSDLPRNL